MPPGAQYETNRAPRSRLLHFARQGLFLAALLVAALFAWHPRSPRVELWVREVTRGYGGVDYWYGIRYPDGSSEQFVDGRPLGGMDIAILKNAQGQWEGTYHTEQVQSRYEVTYNQGLIRPGDEVLCEERFQAIVEELKRQGARPAKLECGECLKLDLPRNWPRLADLLRAAHETR